MAREFVLPLILVLLLLVVLVAFLRGQSFGVGAGMSEGFLDTMGAEGAVGAVEAKRVTLEDRAAQVLQAARDTLGDRKMNPKDEPVVYSVWAGYMSKRGLPPLYITPQVYAAIRGLMLSRGKPGGCVMGKEAEAVAEAIRPVFEKELEWAAYQQHLRDSWKPNYQGSY